MSGGIEAMIAQAERSLGLGENPDNTNYITEWYGLNGEPWCDQGITYWAWHSGNEQAVCFGRKFAYTVEHAQAFADHGQWHAMTNGVVNSGIRRGDIVFFDWEGSASIAGIDHVGIVTGTSGSSVYTIEGNIGNICARKVRTADQIAGFGRPHYVGAPTPAPTPHPSGGLQPFPGEAWFHREPHSPIITRMGQRLQAVGCGQYDVGPGPQWSEADRKSYAAWQRLCGFSGDAANGWPGEQSWNALRVPK